ncbi:MAG: serine/threonine protein kinase [Kofleriaceae bacterium]|nr:serine/threonine protein kinase [Kofleriaceae bacterium]
MIHPPNTGLALRIPDPPETVRNESRWRAQDEEGNTLILSQLRAELASDESLRRRYIYEATRLMSVQSTSICRTIAIGPQKPEEVVLGAQVSDAIAPWRLCSEPTGTRLHTWLASRAPAPIDEAVDLAIKLCRAVHELHQEGFVLRDLEPRNIVLGEDFEITITDVGLARVDILSSRTASSLMLESSPYAAPEHLRATLIDARADIYTLAAIVWQALTGIVPHDDGSPFVRDYGALPELASLRADAPVGLDALLRSCLSENPTNRPSSAGEVAEILLGNLQENALAIERVRCQSCGDSLRVGMRLCLGCGKSAILYEEAEDGAGHSLILRKANETKGFHRGLVRFFEDVGESPPAHLNFLVGDARLYSKSERKSRIHLPTLLLSNLSKASATALRTRLKSEDYDVVVKRDRNPKQKMATGKKLAWAGAGIAAGTIAIAAATGAWLLLIPGLVIGIPATVVGLVRRSQAKKDTVPALAGLRKAPLALPASDPLLAKIAESLSDKISPDVREQVSTLAILLQRLCDHRAREADQASDIELVLAPLHTLVDLAVDEIRALRDIDETLKNFDEGELVRAVAASEARDEGVSKRHHFLDGLDKLRVLEDKRANHMGALLEASSLLRSVVEIGLQQTNTKLLEKNRITTALAGLR